MITSTNLKLQKNLLISSRHMIHVSLFLTIMETGKFTAQYLLMYITPAAVHEYNTVCRYYRSDFNDDDGKITLIAGKGRHWRTVHATTVTYSARFETMVMLPNIVVPMRSFNRFPNPIKLLINVIVKEYFHNKDMLPYPPDDYFRSL